MDFIPKGYITLRAALERAGPVIVCGWTGNELDPDIWTIDCSYFGFLSDERQQWIADRIAAWTHEKWGDEWLSRFDHGGPQGGLAATEHTGREADIEVIKFNAEHDSEIKSLTRNYGSREMAIKMLEAREVAGNLYRTARKDCELSAELYGFGRDELLLIEGEAEAFFTGRDSARCAAQDRVHDLMNWFRQELHADTFPCSYIDPDGSQVNLPSHLFGQDDCEEIFKTGEHEGHAPLLVPEAAFETALPEQGQSQSVDQLEDECHIRSRERAELVGKVEEGLMTPDEAEAEAKRRGWPPLASGPDPAKFDSMQEHDWSLPMAIAWIATGSVDEVRQQWDKYRAECREWTAVIERRRPNGTTYASYLEQLPRARIADIRLRGHMFAPQQPEQAETDSERAMDAMSWMRSNRDIVAAAKDALWDDLRAGKLSSWGADKQTHKRTEIPPVEWRDLCDASQNDEPTWLRSNLSPAVAYDDVIVLT